MKTYFYIIAILIGFSSCSSGKEEKLEPVDFSIDQYPMEFVLTEFSTMMVDSQVTGEDLPYREKYIFREDLTFTKSRTENGETLQLEGEYSRVSMSDENYFKLNYDLTNDLIESCSSDDTEHLIIDSPMKIRGTANACDYPTKTYERVK
ncbi:hypothetical protein LZ575_07170 [Antarcticibacterium sp. 1MA-6-2]|uniref:hypothetical protein n=1 Tax=Antarcticibacterium sp. 1MA-6-2 TaxID=2908210 RepID=UPI001F1DDF30|nr:hypothetical protein [Antarcticibacterium sp. 1MA-6-2]UJH92307.1 hypothetical protein LZ575_07170 [Antarcticibacterium sp. 1MA-6-2]